MWLVLAIGCSVLAVHAYWHDRSQQFHLFAILVVLSLVMYLLRKQVTKNRDNLK